MTLIGKADSLPLDLGELSWRPSKPIQPMTQAISVVLMTCELVT